MMHTQTDDTLLRRQIDENLKRAYTETLNEEIPERFVALLERLQKKLDEITKRDS